MRSIFSRILFLSVTIYEGIAANQMGALRRIAAITAIQQTHAVRQTQQRRTIGGAIPTFATAASNATNCAIAVGGICYSVSQYLKEFREYPTAADCAAGKQKQQELNEQTKRRKTVSEKEWADAEKKVREFFGMPQPQSAQTAGSVVNPDGYRGSGPISLPSQPNPYLDRIQYALSPEYKERQEARIQYLEKNGSPQVAMAVRIETTREIELARQYVEDSEKQRNELRSQFAPVGHGPAVVSPSVTAQPQQPQTLTQPIHNPITPPFTSFPIYVPAIGASGCRIPIYDSKVPHIVGLPIYQGYVSPGVYGRDSRKKNDDSPRKSNTPEQLAQGFNDIKKGYR